ncbi:MAG: hypothetical protein AAFU79_01570 [Myxococcota bacterium]
MALRDAPLSAMRAVLQDYLAPDRLRPLIEGEPRLVGFLGDFEALDAQLGSFEKVSGSSGALRRDELVERREAACAHFDQVLRQAFHVVQAGLATATEASPSPAEVERAEALLFPNGRGFTRRGPAARVAYVEALRVGPEDAALLARLEGPHRTVLELYQELVDTASELSEVLRQLEGLDAHRPPKQDALEAKRRWIQIVQVFRSLVELLELSSETRSALLEGLEAWSEGSSDAPPGASAKSSADP